MADQLWESVGGALTGMVSKIFQGNNDTESAQPPMTAAIQGETPQQKKGEGGGGGIFWGRLQQAVAPAETATATATAPPPSTFQYDIWDSEMENAQGIYGGLNPLQQDQQSSSSSSNGATARKKEEESNRKSKRRRNKGGGGIEEEENYNVSGEKGKGGRGGGGPLPQHRAQNNNGVKIEEQKKKLKTRQETIDIELQKAQKIFETSETMLRSNVLKRKKLRSANIVMTRRLDAIRAYFQQPQIRNRSLMVTATNATTTASSFANTSTAAAGGGQLYHHQQQQQLMIMEERKKKENSLLDEVVGLKKKIANNNAQIRSLELVITKAVQDRQRKAVIVQFFKKSHDVVENMYTSLVVAHVNKDLVGLMQETNLCIGDGANMVDERGNKVNIQRIMSQHEKTMEHISETHSDLMGIQNQVLDGPSALEMLTSITAAEDSLDFSFDDLENEFSSSRNSSATAAATTSQKMAASSSSYNNDFEESDDILNILLSERGLAEGDEGSEFVDFFYLGMEEEEDEMIQMDTPESPPPSGRKKRHHRQQELNSNSSSSNSRKKKSASEAATATATAAAASPPPLPVTTTTAGGTRTSPTSISNTIGGGGGIIIADPTTATTTTTVVADLNSFLHPSAMTATATTSPIEQQILGGLWQ